MRRLLSYAAAAAVACVSLVASGAADAAPGTSRPVTLSPHAVSFGTSMRVHQQRTVTITVSNRGSDAFKIRRASIRNTTGGRAFGPRCPVRIVSTKSGCAAQNTLFGGGRCQVALAFQ